MECLNLVVEWFISAQTYLEEAATPSLGLTRYNIQIVYPDMKLLVLFRQWRYLAATDSAIPD